MPPRQAPEKYPVWPHLFPHMALLCASAQMQVRYRDKLATMLAVTQCKISAGKSATLINSNKWVRK
jgi:hypothetical protein